MKNNELYFFLKEPYVKPEITSDFSNTEIESVSYEENKGVITFKEKLTSISKVMFNNSDSLESVEFPDSIESLKGLLIDADVKLKGLLASEDGKMIVKDGVLLFYNSSSDTTEVEIPAGIKEISEEAFSFSDALKKVVLPESLEVIGQKAFLHCSNLGSVKFPKGLKHIGDYAFSYTGIGSVKILDEVTSIGEGAFNYCPKLKTVTIGKKVEMIGMGAFADCRSLKTFKGKYASEDGSLLIKDNRLLACAPEVNMELPEGIVEIASNVFSHCKKMKSIKMPSSLRIIGDYAFAYTDCSIELPEHLQKIGHGAFIYNDKISKIRIPDSVQEIGDGAFFNCSFLSEFEGKFATEDGAFLIKDGKLLAVARDGERDNALVVPTGVSVIGPSTFSSVVYAACNLILPEGVSEIQRAAFMVSGGYPVWTSISFPSTLKVIGSYAFYATELDENLQLPEGLTLIGENAFERAGLTNDLVKIPSSVKEISKDAFLHASSCNCEALAFMVQSENPPILQNCNALGEHNKIMVPQKAKEVYLQSPVWKELADRFEFY